MKKVFLIFGCFIGKEILSQPDNLMQCRQHSSLSAAGVQDSAAKVVIIIINKRGNRSFGLFWNAVLKEKKNMLSLKSLLFLIKESSLPVMTIVIMIFSMVIQSFFIPTTISTNIKDRFDQPNC